MTSRLGVLAATLSALLAGCAGPPVRIDAPPLPVPLVEPLPLRIAVYLPPAARTYAYKDKFVTGSTFQVGEASTTTLALAFRAGFAEVLELDARAVVPPAGVDALLTLETIDWSVPAAAQPYTTLASYEFVLSNAGGELIGRWRTDQYVQSNETARDPGEASSRKLTEWLEVPSELLLERVAASILLEFREDPRIKVWLESRQAYVPAMPAPAPDPGAADSPAVPGAALPGIHVMSDVPSRPVRRCIIRELQQLLPARRVLAERSVRQVLFPWLSHPLPAGASAERLAALARYPPAVSRFNDLGLGTVVLVAGGTTQDWHGGGFCGAGYGGGGCLGLMWGKRDSFIEAQVLELSRPGELAHAEAGRSGSAVLPMFGLPLPFIPPTQSAACRELGKALAGQLQRAQ